MMQVLESFSTQILLPLALVSRRFYGLVSRLHYARVVKAASLNGHELILECYHPSAKISTPYMFCDYISSDQLQAIGHCLTLKDLNNLYSRYRPVLGEEHRRPRARYATRAVIEGSEPAIEESPSHEIYRKCVFRWISIPSAMFFETHTSHGGHDSENF